MSIENKNYVLVINSLGGGGAERQFSILLDYLPIKKVICLEHENAYVNESNYSITYLTNHTSQTSSLYKYLYIPFYTFKLFKELKQTDNLIILSVLERTHLSVYLLSFLLKLKYVMCFQVSHNSHYKGLVGSFFKFLFKKCANRSNFIVSNSAAGANEIVRDYETPITTTTFIPNGYSFDEIISRSNKIEETPFPALLNQTYILCVARFFSQKAQDKLIRSFATLKQNNPSVKLVFAGIGDRLEDCINLSKSLDLKTFEINNSEFNTDYDVYFLGFQKNPLVLMKHAKIFAFPTFYEGLPNALIEAMICGAVPISSDCPTGPREIIAPDTELNKISTGIEKNKMGILIKPFSNIEDNNTEMVDLWQEALNLLLSDNNLYIEMKHEIESRISEYKIESISSKWLNLLSKV